MIKKKANAYALAFGCPGRTRTYTVPAPEAGALPIWRLGNIKNKNSIPIIIISCFNMESSINKYII